jgi:hypothetical protein
MRVGSVCVGLFLLAAAPALAEPTRWVLYTHPDKLLSVRFPGAPTESDQNAPTPIGDVHFKVALYSDERHALFATAVSYPIDKDAKFDVKTALDGARDQMVANVNGRITSEKSIALDGFSGREVRFEAPGPSQPIHAIARIYASARPARAYIISAMRLTDQPDPEAKRFLDSAHLGKKVELARPAITAP